MSTNCKLYYYICYTISTLLVIITIIMFMFILILLYVILILGRCGLHARAEARGERLLNRSLQSLRVRGRRW